MADKCHICGRQAVEVLLDLGLQPICNRFLRVSGEDEYHYRLVLGQCGDCGLIQISDPPPVAEIVPRYDWITYNEPERHLGDLVEIICSLPGLTIESTICGMTYKDDSLLARFGERGYRRTWRVDPGQDLSVHDRRAGLETIQAHLTPEAAGKIVREHGPADVVIARHILEHTHAPLSLLGCLKRMVKPEGYVVFESPDCSRSLKSLDYSILWEEHVLYFTADIFRRCFGFGGFALRHFETYPYPFEDSLVAIVQPVSDAELFFPEERLLKKERQIGQGYRDGFAAQQAGLRVFLSDFRRRHGKIAVLGAGHLACTFINVMGIRDYCEFVVDDNENKQGLFMPGSGLLICGSASIVENGIRLCLLSFSPESEWKWIRNNRYLLDRGITMASIFPGSKYALQRSRI